MPSVAAAPPRRGWLIANLIGQLTFGLLAMTICLPSLQDWARTFGASQAAVQLTFSGYIVAYGALQLVYGPLSDRIGRRPVLLLGIALGCAGSLLAASAPNLWVLIAARVLQGAGTAAGMVIGRALVQDFFAGPERTRVMAMVGMSMGLVPPTATLLGGQLHVQLGWQANFLLLAALGAALFFAAWKGLPASTGRGSGARHNWTELAGGYARLAREPVFLWHVVLLSTSTAAFYAFLGGAPIVLANYGVTPDRLGLYIMVPPLSYIAGNALTTRLIRVRSEGFLMMAGQLIAIAGLCVVLAVGLAGPRTPLALALPLMLLGIGHGLLVPPTLAGTVGVVPALAGSAAAVAGLMQQVGGALGGYFVGLVPHHGQVNLALQMLGWSLVGFVALVALRRATHHQLARKPPAGDTA
jgi:DHA1 family bicyclomycin/chloramphenicol resistance-like MFS transporter